MNRLNEAVLTCTHNLCFEQKYEKYYNFSSENYHFYSREILLYIAWACLSYVDHNHQLLLQVLFILSKSTSVTNWPRGKIEGLETKIHLTFAFDVKKMSLLLVSKTTCICQI